MPDRSLLAELRIPAHRDSIPVAKMVAATLGSQLGFDLEAIDELKIAVAQACDSTIDEAEELWGAAGDGAVLKLGYGSTERGIAVDVEVVAPRALPGRAGSTAPVPLPQRRAASEAEVQRALARDIIGLFVDDFRHQVDSGRGQIRFRMVKYVIH